MHKVFEGLYIDKNDFITTTESKGTEIAIQWAQRKKKKKEKKKPRILSKFRLEAFRLAYV